VIRNHSLGHVHFVYIETAFCAFFALLALRIFNNLRVFNQAR
jgi:hypothetical protein